MTEIQSTDSFSAIETMFNQNSVTVTGNKRISVDSFVDNLGWANIGVKGG